METYRCAYRDPHSPLTPLTPVCDVSLRENLRDHSPSLVPINTIILDKCPPPKRKQSCIQVTNGRSTDMQQRSPCTVVVSSEKTPPQEATARKSRYLQSLRRILTPNSRHTAKSIDRVPGCISKVASPGDSKPSRFTCFQTSPSAAPMPMSPRVLRILQNIGQERYSEIFRREEIDLGVFKLLTKGDLMKLGINMEKDIPEFLNAIQLVRYW